MYAMNAYMGMFVGELMGKERVILHSDLNNFFASVEIAKNPSLAGKPLIVCGDPKERHGIVLAKNEEAKRLGIKTAETVYSALKKCPNVQMVGSHFHDYQRYSELVRGIYARYTEQIEECSIDECAMDVTESVQLFGSGEEIAHAIRRAVKEELGLTVSIGVSYNKVFAKLASELKKPDAVSVVSRENFRAVVHPLPVGEMLSVGGKTAQALQKIGIYTIGDLANADEQVLIRLLGKRGRQVWLYARGEDQEPVKWQKEKRDLKSVGNSITLPKDITDQEEVKRWLYALSESVSARQRAAEVGRARTVQLVVRNDRLEYFSWQTKVPPTALCGDIAKAAFALFCKHYPLGARVRLLGVTVSDFDYEEQQLCLLDGVEMQDGPSYEKKERAENAIAKLREKYGYATVQRGLVLTDEKLNGLDIRGRKEENTPSTEKRKTDE